METPIINKKMSVFVYECMFFVCVCVFMCVF